MKELFWDARQGGFYFYGIDGEALIARPKELYDGAIPSGNSVATLALQKLADLTDDNGWGEMAERQLHFFAGEAAKYAAGYTYFMMALDYYLADKTKVVIIGSMNANDTKALIRVVGNYFLPEMMVKFYDSGEEFQDEYKVIDGKATAYVCTNFACKPPITVGEKLAQMLKMKN